MRARTSESRSCGGRSPTPTATCSVGLRRRRPGRQGTAGLLLDVFGDIGLERLAGRHPAWVRISPEFLLEVGTPPVRPDKVVLQLAAEPVTDEVLTALRRLQFSGYTLAPRRRRRRRCRVCGIVKLSVAGRTDDELRDAHRRAARAQAELVATDVDTPEELARAAALGFTPFQGDFFAKPDLTRRGASALAAIASLRRRRRHRARRLVRGPRGGDQLRCRPQPQAAALRQLRLLRPPAHGRVRPRGADAPRHRHGPPLGDRRRAGRGRRRRARRARRARAPARPHVRGAGRQPRARRRRRPLHGRPVLRRRRAARLADGGGPRDAPVQRRDPRRAAEPRGSEGRAARTRGRVRARRVPRATTAACRAPTARPWSGPAAPSTPPPESLQRHVRLRRAVEAVAAHARHRRARRPARRSTPAAGSCAARAGPSSSGGRPPGSGTGGRSPSRSGSG